SRGRNRREPAAIRRVPFVFFRVFRGPVRQRWAVASRYVVGIDLGTTNSALAFVDTHAGDKQRPAIMPIPQVVQQGAVEERPLFPSFLYLPGRGEEPQGALRLPWAAERDFAVGEYARKMGTRVETRLVSSAKSWLCHPGVDRKAPVLPFKAGVDD